MRDAQGSAVVQRHPGRSVLRNAIFRKHGRRITGHVPVLLAVKKVKAIPDVTVGNGSETSVNLSDYFYKTDVLTYSLSTQGVIEISLKDSILTIKGLSKGSTVIRITDGNQSVRTINVTVE